jgi:hypothetical protein
MNNRTLLLSPPSLSSHPEKLDVVFEAHDRSATDIQMLDRLSLNLVTLPPSTYDTLIILSDADGTRNESQKLLSREVLASLVTSLKPGGTVKSQDNTFGSEAHIHERTEAILAGLVVAPSGVSKPAVDLGQSVPLRFGKKKTEGGAASTTSNVGTGAVEVNGNGKGANKGAPSAPSPPAGVGFVDFSDDFDAPEEEDSDDELIDEDTLIDEADLKRVIVQREYFIS